MDEQKLADQWQKTGNLMDATFEDWWLEDDPEDDGWCEAGLMARPYYEYLKSLPPEQHKSLRLQAQLLSILLPELMQWVEGWGLGQSFEPVYLETRQTLFRNLKRLTEEQPDWIAALVEEDNQHLLKEERPVRAQTTMMLAQLFSQDDWNRLAEIAAAGMSQAVLQISQSAPLPVTA